VENAWNIPTNYSDSAKRVNENFKNLRRAIKLWAKQLPCLKQKIDKVNFVIELLDFIDEVRALNLYEWNLRESVKNHVITLLQNQKSYWKQREEIKWVKLGDANTKFLHTKATINVRHNHIAILKNIDEDEITDHDGKRDILWKAFKETMGNSDNAAI
jgi:hypothetical protein